MEPAQAHVTWPVVVEKVAVKVMVPAAAEGKDLDVAVITVPLQVTPETYLDVWFAIE